MTLGRGLLMAVSYKNIRICRMYIYYQVIFQSLEWCLPRDYGDMQMQILIADNILNFCLLSFDLWPSCASLMVVHGFQATMNVLHYEQEFTFLFVFE